MGRLLANTIVRERAAHRVVESGICPRARMVGSAGSRRRGGALECDADDAMKRASVQRLPRKRATFHGRAPRLVLQVLHGLFILLIAACLFRFVWLRT